MKKVTLWLCVGMLMLGLSACGTGNGEQRKNAAAETGEGAGMAGGSGAADRTATGDSDGEDVTAGSGALDGAEDGSNKLLALKTMIVDTIGEQNYYPDAAVEPGQLEEIFGISPEMYGDYLAEVSQDGTNIDTLLIIQAKDDKVEAVQEALYAYWDAKVSDITQDPRNIGKVQASRIETNGNYVSFVQLGGDITAALASGEDAVIEQCLQMNELVLEVIAQNVH